jgi:hypothetical protein
LTTISVASRNPRHVGGPALPITMFVGNGRSPSIWSKVSRCIRVGKLTKRGMDIPVEAAIVRAVLGGVCEIPSCNQYMMYLPIEFNWLVWVEGSGQAQARESVTPLQRDRPPGLCLLEDNHAVYFVMSTPNGYVDRRATWIINASHSRRSSGGRVYRRRAFPSHEGEVQNLGPSVWYAAYISFRKGGEKH